MPINRNLRSRSKRAKPLILVSNDDGVHAEGLRILARRLKKLGRVVVVAPDSERSAASHSITLHRPLRIIKHAKDVYSVDGTPTDCINLGINEIMRERPSLIVSGINSGPNLGDDLHYSGTVSAAMEGGILGVPSIAISLVAGPRDVVLYKPASEFCLRLARRVMKDGLPRGVILNVNVPSLPSTQLRGYAFTKQGKRNYGDIIVEKIDPRGKKYYWIGGDEEGFDDIRGSDCNVVAAGQISITPIRVNLTDAAALKNLKGWRL